MRGPKIAVLDRSHGREGRSRMRPFYHVGEDGRLYKRVGIQQDDGTVKVEMQPRRKKEHKNGSKINKYTYLFKDEPDFVPDWAKDGYVSNEEDDYASSYS